MKILNIELNIHVFSHYLPSFQTVPTYPFKILSPSFSGEISYKLIWEAKKSTMEIFPKSFLDKPTNWQISNNFAVLNVETMTFYQFQKEYKVII